jgi:hypothetical protein
MALPVEPSFEVPNSSVITRLQLSLLKITVSFLPTTNLRVRQLQPFFCNAILWTALSDLDLAVEGWYVRTNQKK